MVKKLSISLFLLILAQVTSFAREVGCLIGSNQIYTNKIPAGLLGGILGTTNIYYSTSGITINNQCVSSTGKQCKICNGNLITFLGVVIGCSSNYSIGYEVNYVINCNFDSGSLMLLLLSGSTALLFLYKKHK